MKRRVVKKVEKMMVVEKLCQLQQEIDEHLRFEGDLLVMLCTENPDMKVIDHGDCASYMAGIWDTCVRLLNENKRMARELKEKEA
jgi:hypothetical protein